MSKRTTNHSLDERLTAVKHVTEQGHSVNSVAKSFQMYKKTLKEWIRKYKAHGIDGLKESKTWTMYSKVLKENAVEYYLQEKGSLSETCEKFSISSTSVLRQWIKLYTSGKEFKSTSKGWSKRMNKGRKTTWKERIEIAQYTIANELDYHKSEETFGVSYQQVYGWVRKYKEGGSEALKDRRGRGLDSKAEDNLTTEEILHLRVKELEQRNHYLEAENGLIKKLKEIERRNLRD